VKGGAERMTWKGNLLRVSLMEGIYPTGITVPNVEMKVINARLERSANLPKYDIIIKPSRPRGR